MGHNLIKKDWSIIPKLWKHHNDVLHNAEAIHLISGLNSLKYAIISEYTFWQDILPGVY